MQSRQVRRRTSKFLQSMHLQLSEQKMEAWKHSQYFFRQPLFLQLQPLLWRALAPAIATWLPSSVPPYSEAPSADSQEDFADAANTFQTDVPRLP